MKLAAHLQPARGTRSEAVREREAKRRLLYIFDEPTTGLHFDDVSKLLAAFRRLIEAGGSIVVIEHNLEVIKTADWVIDLGPEGGSRGGKIVGAGPPEAIAKLAGSYTGKYLARILNGNGQHRVPMVARRLAVAVLLAGAAACCRAQSSDAGSSAAQDSQSQDWNFFQRASQSEDWSRPPYEGRRGRRPAARTRQGGGVDSEAGFCRGRAAAKESPRGRCWK